MKSSTRIAIWDLILYASIIVAIELAKEWNLIGAAGLRNYDKYDWIILFTGVWGVAGVTIHAYFNNRFNKQLNNPSDTQPPFKPNA